MKKKIVYVVGGLLTPNGMSTILSNKINYLAEHTDYELYMILTEKAGSPWYYKINPNVKWVNFDINFDELDTMPLLKKVFYYTKKQKRYKRMFTDYLMEIRPDITVSIVRREIDFINDIPDGSKKIGEIHFDRTFYRQFNKRYLPGFMNRAITKVWTSKLVRNLRRLDKFVVLTHEDYDHWPELNNKVVIPNSLSFFPEQSASLISKTVIAVGRYSWQKGFDMLIDAWQRVAVVHPDWTLNIYGAGDNAMYQKMAEDKGVGQYICCHPSAGNIYEKYQESSIFVLSSRYEGFGLVIAEAMSAGLPPVSFACPSGPSDIITDGVDGLLVECGNVKSLAKAINYLIENPEIRMEYGSRAKSSSQRYKIDNIMQKWISLFGDLLEN